MTSVTNTSLQSFEIYLNTEKGAKTHWLKPQETLVIPNHYISSQLENLIKRRICRVQNIK